eukprot:TRINITY_DN759_c0_g2_i1.p1 TRINITY_DN759_c0_g2~~TRINITY_DN759_c0_g2_i1.p1  ORF type:complete len:135 (-),score=23.84 TRINITY_DN759_c0_g2_i1:24-428(-)
MDSSPLYPKEDSLSWLVCSCKTAQSCFLNTLALNLSLSLSLSLSFSPFPDTSAIDIPAEYLTPGTPRDYAFCRWLTKEVGVTAIPPTAFYCDEHKHLGENFARFAFCKTDDSLDEAFRRMQAHEKLGALFADKE